MEDGGGTETTKSPSSWKILLGRLAERICPYAKQPCPDDKCQLKQYCKCAQEEAAAANRLETKLWALLAFCGVSLVLYWIVAS
jgi:hypothetical protein